VEAGERQVQTGKIKESAGNMRIEVEDVRGLWRGMAGMSLESEGQRLGKDVLKPGNGGFEAWKREEGVGELEGAQDGKKCT